MKIPKLFKKKKTEQDEIDKIIKENVRGERLEEIEEVEESEKPMDEVEKVGTEENLKTEEFEEEPLEEQTEAMEMSGKEPSTIKRLRMDVDRVNAQIEAIKQINKVAEERFQRVSEEIGELRRAGIEREREMNKIKVGAEKAAQLVSQVQPEKLMVEVEKEDAQVQKIDAKEKADRSLIDHVANELKDIRRDIEAFRGVESLMELNEEVKKELMNIKKVESMVEKHADRVETIFVKTEKSFSKFLKLSQDFKTLEKRFDEVIKESEKFKAGIEELARKEDIEKIQKDIEDKLKPIDKLKEDLSKKKKFFDKTVPKIKQSMEESKKLEETLRRRISEIDTELSKLTRMEQKKYVTEERFNRELGDFFKSVLDKVESLEKKIKKM